MALQVKRHFSEITWLYKSWLNMFELSYIGNSSNKKGHIDEDIYTYNYIYVYDIICLQYIYVSLIENGVPLKSSGIFMGIRPAPPRRPPQINKETINY